MPISKATDTDRSANQLLATLTEQDFGTLLPHLQVVSMGKGVCLIQPNTVIEHVYFPTSGMVSLVKHLHDGMAIEVGVVGKEGMIGTPVLLGVDQWPVEAMVQMQGSALRIRTADLMEFVSQSPDFHDSLLRFIQRLFDQLTESIACGARHSLSQRLARWLLMAHDRADGNELKLSHEFMGMMLGRRRAGVTVALAELKAHGTVAGRHGRIFVLDRHGRIFVLDRHGLEQAACECYQAAKA